MSNSIHHHACRPSLFEEDFEPLEDIGPPNENPVLPPKPIQESWSVGYIGRFMGGEVRYISNTVINWFTSKPKSGAKVSVLQSIIKTFIVIIRLFLHIRQTAVLSHSKLMHYNIILVASGKRN